MNFERGKDPKQAMELGMYIYDNGFGPVNYVCTNCSGIRLERQHLGGFQPPVYICKDCGETVHSPKWIYLNG